MGAVSDAWDLAADLAALGFDAASLDSAAERYRQRQAIAALRWIVDENRAGRLLDEVRNSTERMSGIVGALKGYSHMDRAEAVHVDIEKGLDDTVVILQCKLRGIDVVRERGDDLPTLVAAGRWALDRDPMLLETSVPGAFAVGDVRSESVKRVASAVGEGSVAVHLVHAYLAR